VKKSLFVLAVLVVACSFAAASNWTFGFESTGHGLYCNYEQLNNNDFSSVTYGGVDNLEGGCGLTHNSAVAGFTAKLSAALNPQGFAIKGVDYGDSIYAAFTGVSYLVWDVASNLKCSEKKFGWVGIADYATYYGSGYIFGDNYGYLSCNIPGKNHQHNGMASTGKKVETRRK